MRKKRMSITSSITIFVDRDAMFDGGPGGVVVQGLLRGSAPAKKWLSSDHIREYTCRIDFIDVKDDNKSTTIIASVNVCTPGD
jgi:hypothetical protein